MKKDEILAKLKELKPKYAKDGIIIQGLFGSYARDEASEGSDIDIAMVPENDYLQHRDVWAYFQTIARLKEDIFLHLGKHSDVFDLSSSSFVNQNIKKDIIYV